MFRKIAVGMSIALAALLFVTQVVIPHSSKPKLRADAEAQRARLEKGREIILRACAAVGGLERWRAKHDVSFRLSDHWDVPASVWPTSNVETTQYYLLHRNIGRVELMTKHGHHQWGLFNGRPWAVLNGEIDSDGLKRAEYAITTNIYLFELPFKFLDAGAYPEFIGEEVRDGKTYDKVYVSFGLNVGYYPSDWFVAYFDHTTSRLSSMIYTNLQKSPSFVEYAATFDDYKGFDDLLIPTSVEVKMARPVSGIKVHHWRTNEVRFDVGFSEVFFSQPATTPISASMSVNMR